MPNPQLLTGQYARGLIAAVPAGTQVSQLIGTIDRYDLAYLAQVNGSAGPSEYVLVVKGAPPPTTVNVTWTGKNLAGATLTPFVAPYDINGGSGAATGLTKENENIAADTPPAPDPGSGTVQFI